MSNELARRTGTYGSAPLTDRQAYALALARSGDLLPRNFWDGAKADSNGRIIPAAPNPGKVLYMTETAAMLGIHPMAGLTSIHIIEGKPTLSASLWASLVREAGHRLRVWTEGEGDNLKAITTLVRKDDPDFEFRVEWSVADARTAGLLTKDNWKKYLRSMLKSRAITEVVREGAPEVGMGAAYTPEELNPNLIVNEQGDPVDLQQVPSHGETPIPDAHYTSGGDGTEPRPRQRTDPPKETPIPDEPKPEPAEGEPEFDWGAAIANLLSRDEALALHAKARQEGKLEETIKQGRRKRQIGEMIVEVGKALAEAEASAAAEDVVEAEIVDDESPMALGGDQ